MQEKFAQSSFSPQPNPQAAQLLESDAGFTQVSPQQVPPYGEVGSIWHLTPSAAPVQSVRQHEPAPQLYP
jgi:hypothetical protein